MGTVTTRTTVAGRVVRVKGLDDDVVLLLTPAAAAACRMEGEVDGEHLVAVMPP